MTTLRVKKLHPNAKLPERKTDGSVGYDLYACESTQIPPLSTGVVGVGLSLEIPSPYYGRIAPRSSLAVKSCISVGGGVIDQDYRGELKVILFNHNAENIFTVDAGDRIAQLILQQVGCLSVEEVDSLACTERGEGGFGSTGKNDNDGTTRASPLKKAKQDLK